MKVVCFVGQYLTTSFLSCASVSSSLCVLSPSLSPYLLWNLNYCVLSEVFKDGKVLKEAYYQVLPFGFLSSFLSRVLYIVDGMPSGLGSVAKPPTVLLCNADLGLVPTPELSET